MLDRHSIAHDINQIGELDAIHTKRPDFFLGFDGGVEIPYRVALKVKLLGLDHARDH